jgi:23S rRNA (cytosine1962-C5)-methyltransferase
LISKSIVIIKPGRERSILRKHPWIFSGSIDQIWGTPENGEVVEVRTKIGDFLAWGVFNRNSQISVRIWSWELNDEINSQSIYNRLRVAIDKRKFLLNKEITNAYRLVYSESDNLPGLIVDLYDDCLVLQVMSSGIELFKQEIIEQLHELTGCTTIYERSDIDTRRLEGMEQKKGLLFGKPPGIKLLIYENGLEFYVDVVSGQKTGFFLDQRENRYILREFSNRKDILDCFCYSGGFLINGVKGGANSIIAIENSNDAIEFAKMNIELNKISSRNVSFIQGDVFQELRKFRDQKKDFDLIILDPPKFAQTSSHVEKAARGYKDINLLAFKLLKPGGILFTFSCSGGVSAELFHKIIADAALDAGVSAQIIKHLHQSNDHPISLNFPESEYLKGFIILRE